MKHVYINHQSICTAKLYLPVEKNVQCQQKQQWNKIVNLFKITNKVTWIEVGQVNLLFNFEKVWCLHLLFWAKWELFMYCLTLLILVSTKRSHVLTKTCSFQLEVFWLICVLFVDTRHRRIKNKNTAMTSTKLTINTSEFKFLQNRRPGCFIVNFGHINTCPIPV